MENRDVTIKLPAVTLVALQEIAGTEDVSIGHIIRDAIERDLRRRQSAKTPVRADERLVAPLRALLADDFAYAKIGPIFAAACVQRVSIWPNLAAA